MSQKHSKSQDEISQLLDSFEVEDTLEEKMENFTQEKERQSRIERARKNSQDFNRRNTEEMDLTQIIDPIDDSEFEDEEYYYYVRAIPKVTVEEEEFNVTQITVPSHRFSLKRKEHKQEHTEQDKEKGEET